MNVQLYPYHALEPYPDSGNPDLRIASIVSALLYFDSITLGRLGYPNELGLPSGDQALAETRRIEAVRGTSAINAFFTRGEFTELTIDEVAVLSFVKYWYREAKFRQSYAPLLEEGLVRIASLAEITEQARSMAQAAGSNDASFLNMAGPLAGFIATYDEFANWPSNPADNQVFSNALQDADGLELTSLYLRKILQETKPEFLEEKSQIRKGEFFHRQHY